MTIDEKDQGADRLCGMAVDAAGQSDPAQTSQRIVELAATLIPCVAVDIVHRGAHGVFRITASSDRLLSDRLGRTLQEWPHDPYPKIGPENTRVVADHPVGYLRQRRQSTGIVAELTFFLRVGDVECGFLRFLLADPAAPNPADSALGAAFAAHAAIVLDRAVLQQTVGNLLTAIVSNREIGAAVGILMARGGIGYDAGFQLLKTASQNNNRKLRDVVEDVIYTGELPDFRLQHATRVRRPDAA